MKGEERFATYYAFLSLFTFSMLGLVLSGNVFQVYMFWELVGVSSFLLIGYYFDKPSAVAASKKAFIVTRFADLGFLIGILILAFYGKSLDISTLIERLTSLQSTEFTGIATAGFLGYLLNLGININLHRRRRKICHVPFAYLVTRCDGRPYTRFCIDTCGNDGGSGCLSGSKIVPGFLNGWIVMMIVTWVGAFSALLAAVIACTQTDIKRVLAYSTMSQIGYMMFALGISKQRERMDWVIWLPCSIYLHMLFSNHYYSLGLVQ
jgi:NADH-quinone oxidoreductase subunit L